ncbi:MAG: VOC family protein [Alphaproteobacteria bacterium]|nr:VOC family protein [Alphaproteobacteria bacterium]
MNDQTIQFAWGHININVSNLERSIAFYEKLGFEVYRHGIPYLDLTRDADTTAVPDTSARALGLPAETQGRACIMQLGRGYPKLDLTEFENRTPKTPLSNGDLGIVRLCLVSQNLEEDYVQLRAEGVTFLSAPQPCKGDMADIAICRDPDGTLIELIQAHRDKWPPLTPKGRRRD